MMKNTRACLYAIILAVLFMLCVPFPSALAAGSTAVIVNGVELNAATPYWQNGSLTASATEPAGGWNAYFDAATATLTLKDAVLNTTYDVGYHSLVYANEDVRIVFRGQNNFTYTTALPNIYVGVYAHGDITIDGDGSADFQLKANDADAQAGAIYSDKGLTILGGALTMDVRAGFVAVGARGANAFLYAGGHMDIYTEGSRSYGVYVNFEEFRMTGGSISATSVTTDKMAYALGGNEIYLEGGEGVFRAYGPNDANGLYLSYKLDDIISFTGGRYIFSGDTSALMHNRYNTNVTYTLTGGPVFVSEATSGAGMWQWTSAAKDGRLESDLDDQSSFKYVQFRPVTPTTGDGQAPWLWAGIAGVCLLLFAGVTQRLRNGIIW